MNVAENSEEEHNMSSQCDDIKQIVAVIPQYIKRLEKVEERTELHSKTINELVSSHAETKVYIKMILDKVGGMEGNMFGYMKSALKEVNKERMETKILDNAERTGQSQERMKSELLDHEGRISENNERFKTTANWQVLIKYIVGATIGVLVGGVAVYLELKARGVIK